MRKNVENFEVKLGDVAITKSTRNKISYIEAAFTTDENIRALYTYPDCMFISGNIPIDKMQYVTAKVKKMQNIWRSEACRNITHTVFAATMCIIL